jgi:hypothetical protein
MLPRSWARQFGQAGQNISHYGLQNTAEGIMRYIRDPELRALIKSSGATSGSMQHLFEAMRRGESPNLVGRAIGWSESKLRGPLSAGAIPYIEQTTGKALGQSAKDLPRALGRQLSEMNVDVKDLNTRDPADILRDAYSGIVGRVQLLSGDPGQTSASLIGTQAGRLIGQYRPFSLGAARLAKEDYLSPILSGLKNRDLGELGLGLGRTARLLPAALVAQQAAKTLLLPQGEGLNEYLDIGDTLGEAARTNIGLPADLATAYLGGSTRGTGIAKAIASLTPPLASMIKDPDLYKLGMMALPPQYAGPAAMAYPALKSYLP